MPKRCFWAPENDPVYLEYHDTEWGVPCHDDAKLYEMLILESFQAGLSWACVLHKREAFRRAYDGFDVTKVAGYDAVQQERLMNDPGIIRNRLKIRASVLNSIVFLQIQKEFGSFDRYLWGFTDGKSIREDCRLRTTSPLSDRISADLKRRGMAFVGSTVIYSYLQAVGVLAAHEEGCFCCRD